MLAWISYTGSYCIGGNFCASLCLIWGIKFVLRYRIANARQAEQIGPDRAVVQDEFTRLLG